MGSFDSIGYFEELLVFQAGLTGLKSLAWNNGLGRGSALG
jgi:hypothetical protein